MIRVRLVLAVGIVALVAAASVSAMATPKLTGTVGPGFTITLKKGSAKVTRLTPGKYTLVVTDKSSIHNFHIKGPGLNKVVTDVGFTGTKTVTITLRAGKYTYVCDPHSSILKGSFSVA